MKNESGIGEYASSKCEKLEQIRLSENLNTISAHMFLLAPV